MSKSSHVGDADRLTQNQNNAMSDDPGDGGRKSFKAGGKGGGADGSDAPPGSAPDEQGSERLAELGRQGSRQD